MMIAAVGPMLKVTGSRIAVPATGPMPGSTPISIPSRQPVSAKSRFVGCMAVAKPAMRRSKPVMTADYQLYRPTGSGWLRMRENR
jgi:hypothetical protein